VDVPRADRGVQSKPVTPAGAARADPKRFSPARLLRMRWDGLVSLVAALALAVLSVLDVLPEDQVPTATLGVLALVCFTMVRDNADREAMSRLVETLSSRVTHLSGVIAAGDDRVHRLIQELTTTVRRTNELYEVPREAVGLSYIDVLKRTLIWKYKGGTGTILRAETLPRLVLSAAPGLRRVWVEIIDPRNLRACTVYSTFRHYLLRHDSIDDSENWSLRRVRIESYAAVVAALWYESNYDNMTVELALSSTASTFRLDMTCDFVMVTNEHSESPALRTDEGGDLYTCYAEDLRLSFEQARQVDLTKTAIDKRFNGRDVSRVLNDLLGDHDDDGFLTPAVCREIAGKAISEPHAAALGMTSGNAHNPYGWPA
jgi:hypothetical protein